MTILLTLALAVLVLLLCGAVLWVVRVVRDVLHDARQWRRLVRKPVDIRLSAETRGLTRDLQRAERLLSSLPPSTPQGPRRSA